MAAPKSLQGKGGKWVLCRQQPNSIYEMDPLDCLNLVGKVMKTKLEKQGLANVKQIKDLSREQIEAISKLEKGKYIGLQRMLGFQQQAKVAILGDPPEPLDYRKAENPW